MTVARACPRKLLRCFGAEILFGLSGSMLLGAAFVGAFFALPPDILGQARGAFVLSLGAAFALPLLVVLGSWHRFRRDRSSVLRLERGCVESGGRSRRLGGPALLSRKGLILSTREGPVLVRDIFDRPLAELQAAAQAGSRPEESSRAEVELGSAWTLSSAWPILLGLALWTLEIRGPGEELMAWLPGLWIPHLLIFVLIACAAVTQAWADPSRKAAGRVALTDRSIAAQGDDPLHIPLEAVTDVYRRDGLVVECRNGYVARLPAEALERELNEACGLDPDRYVYFSELVRLTGSRWKALKVLLCRSRDPGKPVLRSRL